LSSYGQTQRNTDKGGQNPAEAVVFRAPFYPALSFSPPLPILPSPQPAEVAPFSVAAMIRFNPSGLFGVSALARFRR
jgi:hypothetical protein